MTPESVTAIAAVVVAAAALGISIWEGSTSRRHNRLSVKPVLCFIWRDHPGHPLRLTVQNMGLGPASIRELEISFDPDAGESAVVNSAFDMCLKLGLKHVRVCWSPEPQEIVAAGMEVPFVVFHDTLNDETDRKEPVLLLQKAEFQLTYASAYCETFTLVYRIASKKHPVRSNKDLQPAARRQ